MWSILMPMDHNKEKRAVRRTEGTTRPKTSSGKIMRGAVGITANLLDEISTGRLNSLHAEDVVPFLKDRLTWKIFSVRTCIAVFWILLISLQGNGTQLSRSNLDAIAVEVASTTAQIPSDPNDPIVYSDQVETYPEITLKGAGGDTA
jgi:tyrosinase